MGRRDDHCCWFNGDECPFLLWEGRRPRCAVHAHWGHLNRIKAWRESVVGKFFRKHFPGYDCLDWPDKLPDRIWKKGWSRCCFEEGDKCRYGD